MLVNLHIMSPHNADYVRTHTDLLRGTLNIFQLEGRKTRHLSGLLFYTVYVGISYFVNINARLTQEICGSSVVCNLC